jgi:lambda repressor-like predicted transcriptional regulator
MPRPESTITSSGPVADFARQLRLLRQNAALSLRQLAASTGLSTATLSAAAAGRKLPSWAVTKTYVQACGGNADDWRARWECAGQSSRLVPAAVPHGRLSRAPGRPWGNNLRLLGGPAPLPVTAETACEFMDCLLRVKIWAGDPSIRALSQRAGLPPSTMQDFLRRKRTKLPAVEMVCAFLEACGVEDPNVIAEWVYVWRRLKFAEAGQRYTRAERPESMSTG